MGTPVSAPNPSPIEPPAGQANAEASGTPLTSDPLVRKVARGKTARFLTRVLDDVSGLTGVRDVYDRTREVMARQGKDFCTAALDALDLSVRIARSDVERIPKRGGLVVAANHPFGGIEGVVLVSLLKRVRPDVKILANELLAVFDELRPDMIAIDVFGGEKAGRTNAAGMRDAIKHLKGGGCLIVFPAGEVSHFRGADLGVTDSTWQRGVGMLVRRSGAAVLPVFVPGGNGLLFNVMGFIHPRLRTALLPRSTVKRRGTSMEIRVGAAVPAKRLAELALPAGRVKASASKLAAGSGSVADKGTDGDDAAVMEYLRRRTYMLRYRKPGAPEKTELTELAEVAGTGAEKAPIVMGKDTASTGAPIIPETPAVDIEREIAALSDEALMVPGEEYCAYVARPRQIPHVLREIGRLREITFRTVGEGTGKPSDLDDFDYHYLHLFVWHRKDRRIVGAYRLGRADLILRAKGKRGLYTSTLFNFPERLLQRLGGAGGSAVEMGRSFVRQEYQRSHQPLLMLWKAIGAFSSRNPQYHTLFGPVSISASYATVSRQLMVQFLSMSGLRADGAEMVKARAPFRMRRFDGLDPESLARLIRDQDDVSELVADVEPDSKGIPVLLSQYLKLGARVLSFNVDKDFGGCLDALVTVDLRKTDRKLLTRYMGKDGYAKFAAYHKLPTEAVVTQTV